MKIFSIPTGNLKMDGGAMFGVVPKILWQKNYPADENNFCNWAMRCLLIDDGPRKILVDTGIGDKQDEKFFSKYHLNGNDNLINSLTINGYSTDDITDIIFTHLHFDHVGGALKYNKERSETELTFKNATYWISRQQWNCAINPNRKEKPSFLKENIIPIEDSGHLKFIKNDTLLFTDILVKLFYGHTDGQVIPFISYKGKTIVFMGDMIASSAHIPVPYVMGYDVNPLTVIAEKEKFLADAAEKQYILFFEHDLNVECCTVCKTEKNDFRVRNVFQLVDV